MDAGFLLLPEFLSDVPDLPVRAPRRPRPEPEVRRPTVRIQRLRPHDTLFDEGDRAGDVFEVTRGTILVLRTLPDGRRQIVDVVGPGRLFGFTAADRHRCTAVAATAGVVCRLDRAEAMRHPGICERLAQATLDEIDRLRDLALALGRKTALERVASFLLSLAEDPEAATGEIHLPVTRAEMADHLGLTIETVSRNITRLKRDGLLAEERGERILLPDRRRLGRIAAGTAEAA